MPCQGPHRDDKEECNIDPCPVNGDWNEWGEWDVCQKPCGVSTSLQEGSVTNQLQHIWEKTA